MLILPASLPAKPAFLDAPTPSSIPLPPKPITGPQGRTQSTNEQEEVWCTPWIDSLPATEHESKEKRLHDEVVAFLKYVRPTLEDTAGRQKVVTRLIELIQRRFWNCEVKIFGSIAQDLSLPGGDVDLTIQTPQVEGGNYRVKCLYELSRMLRDSFFSDQPFVVAHARVPILTFETRPALGGMKFDVNINSNDGSTAIPLIKQYMDSMPALRPLILLVKTFLARRGLNSAATGGLGSYAATLLIISFLQLRPGDRPTEVYDKPMENESMGLLLMDFFQYYHADFPYETSYISVLQAGLLPKQSKGWLREKHLEALSIESIIDPDRDVGGGCRKIGQVRTAFGEAYDALKKYPFSATNGNNILGSILGVSNKAVEHRERMKRLVQSGDLDKALSGIMLPLSWGTASVPNHGRRNGRPSDSVRGTHQRERYPPSNGRRHEGYHRSDHHRPYPDMAPFRGGNSYAYDNRHHPYQPYFPPHYPW